MKTKSKSPQRLYCDYEIRKASKPKRILSVKQTERILVEEKTMKNCPWCKNKAVIRNSPFGYFAECSKNGHIHNIGVIVPITSAFSKTEKEAEEMWDKSVVLIKQTEN